MLDKKIIFNTGIRWTGEIVNKVVWFIFMIMLARLLGDKNFGYFSYAISFSTLFVVLTDLGTNMWLTKEISKNKEQTNLYFSNILGMKLFLSLLVFIIIYILAVIFFKRTEIVIFFSIAFLVSAFLDPFISLYRAYKQMYLETFVIFLWKILLVSLSLIGIVLFRFGLLEISYVFIFSGISALFVAIFISKRNYDLKLKKNNLKFWYNILRKSVPIGIIILFNAIFFKLNTIILGYFKTSQEVGWYSASFRLIEGTFFLPSIFVASIFPFFCEYSENYKEKLNKIILNAMLWLSILSVFVAAIMFIFSNKIITILYGKEYIFSVKSLKIISWSLMFIFLNELLLSLFISASLEYLVIKVMSVFLLFYFLLCILFIPTKGFIGSSYVLLINQMFLFFSYTYLVIKNFFVNSHI